MKIGRKFKGDEGKSNYKNGVRASWLWCESSTKFIMKNIPELLTEIILRVDLVGTKPLQLVAYNSTLIEVNIR